VNYNRSVSLVKSFNKFFVLGAICLFGYYASKGSEVQAACTAKVIGGQEWILLTSNFISSGIATIVDISMTELIADKNRSHNRNHLS
jgi:hypothetical protein